jgi:hypothetical protein
MSAPRPQTKHDLCATLYNKVRVLRSQTLVEEQVEALYERLRQRGVIKYAPALGVYLSRELTAQDLCLDGE